MEEPLLPTVAGDDEPAVLVRDLSFKYEKKTSVLSNFNVTVDKGSIYALLGPSGCGKSTALKTIIGRLKAKKGQVKVFGDAPGVHSNASKIGYAPQEVALYPIISVDEILRFYGRMHGVTGKVYEDRVEWLADFLELPPRNRIGMTLSGGQQRRLSLACAMLHDPDILLLDEPTVGLDPLLRQKIWVYLRKLADHGVTTIITTHYIEEARQADVCGLMRNGQLLAEDNPDVLMERHGHDTLEGVFLQLCLESDRRANSSEGQDEVIKGGADERGISGGLKSRTGNDGVSVRKAGPAQSGSNIEVASFSRLARAQRKKSTAVRRTAAVAARNLTLLRRDVRLLITQLCLPTLQISLYCLAVGTPPTGLKVAYVNMNDDFGAAIVNELRADDTLSLIEYGTVEEATHAVEKGKCWGVIAINNVTSITEGDVVEVRLDMSNQEIDSCIITAVQNALVSLMQDSFHINPAVKFGEPIFGSSDIKFSDFVGPAIIACMGFSNSIVLTAVSLVNERVQGTLDRVYVSGGRPLEVILGSQVAFMCIVMMQGCCLIGFGVGVFGIPMRGHWLLLVCTMMFLCITGMTYGLVISAIAQDVLQAIQFALGSFFPILLLSGVIWPIEGIPVWLRWLSYAFPSTWGAESLRSIMIRGWSIEYLQVWCVYPVCAGWTSLFTFLGVWLQYLN